MGEKRVVVPEGMYDAAMKYQDSGIQCGAALEAALRWLSENPIVPSVEQCDAIRDVLGPREDLMQWQVKEVAFEWQRRMFLAPEPEDKRLKVLRILLDINEGRLGSVNIEQYADAIMNITGGQK